MRSVSNFNTGFPNMRGHISNHAATMAEVLRDEGYTTFAVGKWHLCQMEDASAAGPVRPVAAASAGSTATTASSTARPTSSTPSSSTTTTASSRRRRAEDGYHLSEDLVDHAIGFVHDTKSIRPDRPFFMYLAFGATHAPHQAPRRVPGEVPRARSTTGWDVARDALVRPPARARARCPPARSSRRATPASKPWDDAAREPPPARGAAPGGVRRASSSTPTPRSAASSTRSSASASSTTR